MRSDAREAAFKMVYASLFHEVDGRFQAEMTRKLTAEEKEYALRVFSLTEQHREELIALLGSAVKGYDESRVYPVDKAILLVALAEIGYCDDIPPAVSASEAAGLARKYSTENSANFVNGVIGGVINK